jgi:hypothetical protein
LRPYNSMPCYYLLDLHLKTQDVAKARQTLGKCSELHDGFEQQRLLLLQLELRQP